MDIVGILTRIGVNDTFYLQLGIFVVTFYFLIFGVLRPYNEVAMQRRQSTEGNEEEADKIAAQTETLTGEYESLAKRVNNKIREIFDSSKKTANQKATELIATAKADAEGKLKKDRESFRAEAVQARQELEKDLPAVSRLIVSKLVGREG